MSFCLVGDPKTPIDYTERPCIKTETPAAIIGREIKEYCLNKPITLYERIIHWIKAWVDGNRENAWIPRGQVAKDLNGKVVCLKSAIQQFKREQQANFRGSSSSEGPEERIFREGIKDISAALNLLKGIGLSKDTKEKIEEIETTLKTQEKILSPHFQCVSVSSLIPEANKKPSPDKENTDWCNPDALD